MKAVRQGIVLGLMLMTALPLRAEEVQKGVIIVDGKKFFSLSGVRRYSGSAKPMPPTTEKKSPKSPITHVLPPQKPLELTQPSGKTIPENSNAKYPPNVASQTILSIFSPEESYSDKSSIKK